MTITPEQAQQQADSDAALKNRVELLRGIQRSPVWVQVIQPVLEAKMQMDLETLSFPFEARKPQHSDEYLRGRINVLKLFLTEFEQTVKVYDMESMQRQMEELQLLNTRRQVDVGRLGPDFLSQPSVNPDGTYR